MILMIRIRLSSEPPVALIVERLTPKTQGHG